MFRLTVESPNLDDFSVVLVKSTGQPYSIVCGLWPAAGGLSTRVDIGVRYYAYASAYNAGLQDGVTISSDTTPLLLARGYAYEFDGTQFVQKGPLPSSYDYGLCNGKQSGWLTCGLCQDVIVDGVAAKRPVSVQRLPPNTTTYVQTNNRFLLGVGQFGPGKPQPGLVLSTSILHRGDALEGPLPTLLGELAQVDFSKNLPNWVASYRPSTNSFLIRPAVKGG